MKHGIDFDQETGAVTILCVRRQRSKPCSVCGRSGDRLCDGLKARLAFGSQPRTCDASLCTRCATPGAGGTDLCPSCVGTEANRAVAP